MAGMMTDIAGYRSDAGAGGALGAGMQNQLRRILSSKAPLLNTPGTVIENDLYYDASSSSVTAVEMQNTFGKDQIAFTNAAMGTNPAAYVPSVYFAGTTFLHLVLKQYTCQDKFGQGSNYVPFFHMCHGWGFHAVQNIVVYMGASSVAQIEMGGFGNFMFQLAACETKRKREAMISAAGQYMNTLDAVSQIAPATAGKALFRRKVTRNAFTTSSKTPATNVEITEDDEFFRHAFVPIRLPFSSMVALEQKLSLDTHLSTQPIQININLRPDSELIQTNIPFLSQALRVYDRCTLELWQQELSDKSLSVRNELLAMPNFNVGYPFQYAQTIPFAVSQFDSGQTSQKFVMNVSSIINSDLTTFLFAVQWEGDYSPNTIESGVSGKNKSIIANTYAALMGRKLINVVLKLNGQRFFVFEGDGYSGVYLAKNMDEYNPDIWVPTITYKNCWPRSDNDNDKTLSGKTTWPIAGQRCKSYIYEFNNSKLRSIPSEAHMQNTARFTNQTFQLEFQIDRSYVWEPLFPYDSTNPRKNFTLQMCYLYNAVFLIGGDGGTTKLITN